MTTASFGAVVAAPGHRVVFRGREIPVVLPQRGDPRLRISAVVLTLQFLGQTVLGFKVSLAQILVSVGFCALIELTVTLRLEGALVWPASGMLTGNSVAFILRASGTRHGDWWTLHGVQYFIAACGLSMLSKYLIRPSGRHLFNPSNVGLVWCLLVVGPDRVFPQYLWWGAYRAPVFGALVVIALGAVWVLRPVKMTGMAGAFFVTFAAVVAVLSAAGRSFVAHWHTTPVRGVAYWTNIVASPELLIFVFFMMSDPKTAPRTRSGRIVYGAGAALVAGALMIPQTTEFGIKLAVLSSLTVTCALVPLIEARTDHRTLVPAAVRTGMPVRRWAALAARPVVLAAIIVAVAAPVDTAALAVNPRLVLIERGLTGHGPQ
ncbi:MAG: hypothetical protein NVSMB4_17140 [Acidimicrobiales bacterium]